MQLGRKCFPASLRFGACRWPLSSTGIHRRYSSGPEKPTDGKAFSKTLLLPKTSFPLWSEPSKSEALFQKRTGERLYRWQWDKATGPMFVLHDGPPYANGSLHMGHALNKILKDIINRFHVLLGHRVHYIPGWDCHGLPIENKALQELGKASHTVPARTIREAAKATAIREISSQKAQFQHFGIMADWNEDSTYRTLDHKYEMRQLSIFQKMVEKGLIYRHHRPVHYSPSSRSALAEAELVYKDDHVSHSVYVTFDVARTEHIKNPRLRELVNTMSNMKLLVWTTTPWTLTANMAIAVHPELSYALVRARCKSGDKVGETLIIASERIEALSEIIGLVEVLASFPGAELVDITYKPLFAAQGGSTKLMSIILSSHVTADSGTGLVHCAPAHGAEDYQVFRTLDLLKTPEDLVCHIDSEGKFHKDVVSVVGDDLSRLLLRQEVLGNGGKVIVNILKEMGCLVKVKRIKHRYPYDWKTDQPIIVTATSQWFANLDNIKNNALKALVDVSFFPPVSRNRLESFIRSRSEWCISRQRVWGVPIPALYRIATDEAVLNTETLTHILAVLDKKGVQHWWDGPVEDFILPSMLEPSRPASEIWRKGTDTMDVWFDSGTSWSMLPALGVGKDTATSRSFHADVCLEGSDQHRGWFQSQLLTAIGTDASDAVSSSPYGTLITHGMVLDQEGKKMSKSLGNVISPLTIVFGGDDKKKDPAYGADVLRLWAATSEFWRDMSIGSTVLAQTAESLRKIRNSARFLLGNVGDASALAKMERVPKSQLGLIERYMMHELYKLEQTALEGYHSYNFPKVMAALTNFANITLSSFYFDITKDCLYATDFHNFERRSVITVFEQILSTMTSVMAPVLPHLAEEIHEHWKSDGRSIFMDKWEPLSPLWEDPEAASAMSEYFRLRNTALALLEKARSQKLLRSSLEAEIDVVIPTHAQKHLVLTGQEQLLKTLFIVSDVTIGSALPSDDAIHPWTFSQKLPIESRTQREASHTETLRDEVLLRIRPAIRHKCPRCWTYSRIENGSLCRRCSDVVGGMTY
ncbi:tRNA synthetases class I (I, L, M and V) domain containing protein [Amanita muscaria]